MGGMFDNTTTQKSNQSSWSRTDPYRGFHGVMTDLNQQLTDVGKQGDWTPGVDPRQTQAAANAFNASLGPGNIGQLGDVMGGMVGGMGNLANQSMGVASNVMGQNPYQLNPMQQSFLGRVGDQARDRFGQQAQATGNVSYNTPTNVDAWGNTTGIDTGGTGHQRAQAQGVSDAMLNAAMGMANQNVGRQDDYARGVMGQYPGQMASILGMQDDARFRNLGMGMTAGGVLSQLDPQNQRLQGIQNLGNFYTGTVNPLAMSQGTQRGAQRGTTTSTQSLGPGTVGAGLIGGLGQAMFSPIQANSLGGSLLGNLGFKF